MRLGLAAVLNVVLVLYSGYGARSSGCSEDVHGWLALLILSALAVVAAVPLYWRGQPWQAAIVLPLIFLPFS